MLLYQYIKAELFQDEWLTAPPASLLIILSLTVLTLIENNEFFSHIPAFYPEQGLLGLVGACQCEIS